ncbi:hypothetical protein GCM10010168_36490 [Actinoplanes ianthinogenes]|uniref:HEAT repeat protein n=1 Tax=Actinoplanes ianthinogenes TaxID=122358 RepID=A0ABN6CQK0_9ACTN|nr:HEAT repeat domain-containing protein [Actinoplanes ianthinogenes]BCJ46829.1 hypothetical protein Aiant_74860 [Actinoplanes ianthinogenes]GGR15231.1 hypothetical protein GCM10010168_36490 [Actinoplanes ianthinogenes]
MRIDELIEQLAGERNSAGVLAARAALVARGAEAVGPVLAVLCDVGSPVDWSDSGMVLREIGLPAFEPVRDALAAATEREMARRCGWTFHGLSGVEPAVYREALRHPSPAVRRSAAYVFQGLQERAEPFLPELAELLGDPDEGVRQRAVWAFQAIGAVGVPLLHAIRRGSAPAPGEGGPLSLGKPAPTRAEQAPGGQTRAEQARADRAQGEQAPSGPTPGGRVRAGRRRAAALTALAGIGGWDLLEAADQAAVSRLIAVKADGEVPGPMHLCGSWFALPTGDQGAVLDAFGLVEPVPVTMRLGESAWNHDHHDWSADREHRTCRRMYVTPVLDGWTLVFGSPHVAGDSFREAVFARLGALSERFGAAHWYGASCGDGWTAWSLAERGEVVRYYDAFEPEDQIGDSHPAEEGFRLPHEDGFPVDAFAGVDVHDPVAFQARYEQVKRDLAIPDEAHATTVAARISVDPSGFGPQTTVGGRAVLASTSCNAGRPSPSGALKI